MEIFPLTRQQRLECVALLGPIPILSSEDQKRADKLYEAFVAALMAQDLLELMCMRDIAYETILIERYRINQTCAVERAALNTQQNREQLKKLRKERRDRQLQKVAERLGQTPADVAELIALERDVEEVPDDLDSLFKHKALEVDLNAALERSLQKQQWWDALINSATKRRNNALQMLDFYRAGMGKDLIAMVNKLSRESFERTEGNYALPSPPTVPAQGKNSDDIDPQNNSEPAE